jgi:regulator of protease activity HflC (stomatin/prohibitin superfamily)
MANGADMLTIWLSVVILIVFLLIFTATAVVIIKPWEIGLKVVMGKFVGTMQPGLNIVPPFITKVMRVDLRTQHMVVPHQEFLTRDKVPVIVDVTIVLKVVDPTKATFQVKDYKVATVDTALSLLRTTIGTLTVEEALEVRPTIIELFTEKLDVATDPWGIKVEKLEVRKIDPGQAVLAALSGEAVAAKAKTAAVMKADAHMIGVIKGDMTPVERDSIIGRTREALDFLPSGLPESLWGWEADALAEAVADGETAQTEHGTPLVKIRGKWYINDPRDMATFLNEWHRDPDVPPVSVRKGVWK